MKGGRYLKNQGAVLIEFVVAVPLCLVFITGILSAGRLLNQVSAVGQAAFLGAMVGTQLNSNTATELQKITDRVNSILDLQSRKVITTILPTYNIANRTITVDVHGDLPFFYQHLDIDLKVVAPLMLLDQSSVDLSNPDNPALADRVICFDPAKAKCKVCPGGQEYKNKRCL